MLTRRGFVGAAAAVGGGLAIGLVSPGKAAAAARSAEIDPWLTIATDDSITLRVTMPEIGNGAMTQAALCVAEELGCNWSAIAVEPASPAREARDHVGYGAAGGSVAWFGGRSMLPDRMALLLRIGAEARERLRAAAAQRWSVPLDQVQVAEGRLRHAPTGRTLGFGALADLAATVKLSTPPAVKPQAEWRLLGRLNPGKLGTAAVVAGTATYGIDVRPPGMVYAALRQSPVHGGRLLGFDAAAVRTMPGVIAVVAVEPSGRVRSPAVSGEEPTKSVPFSSGAQAAVAVVAEHYWQARQALEQLPVRWEDHALPAFRDNAALRAAAFEAADDPAAKVLLDRGTQPLKAAHTVSASYLTPYCEHAPIEPLNVTALVNDDGVEVWQSGQHAAQGLWVAADEAGVPIARARHHQTRVGGGFGRRIQGDDVRMAVAVARQCPGRPVQLIWSREEATRQGRYRPLAAARFTAELGSDGLPLRIAARTAQARGFPPLGLVDSPYFAATVPAVHVTAGSVDAHLLTGSFRGPSYNSYAFMVDSFIDECAVAAGIDPLEYRLRALAGWPDPGWRRCLEAAAAAAKWGSPLPRGEGLGIAVGNWGGYGRPQHGTTVATVARVAFDPELGLTVKQLHVAFDCGRMTNRNQVLHQISGASLFGVSLALNEGLTVRDGAVVDGNFDTLPLLKIDVAPEVNVHFDALTGHDRFGEIGEVAVAPASAAVGNAIFAATGLRLREQPFRTALAKAAAPA